MSDIADRTPAQTFALMVLFFSYVALGAAVTWLGYWYSQAFIFGSPLIATLFAIRQREYWPVVDPALGFFFCYPLYPVLLWLLTPIIFFTPDPIVDWLPWLGASFAIALIVAAAFVLLWRKHIEREWAVVATLCVVFVYAAWTLESLDEDLPQPPAQSEQVRVLSTIPGGYRQGGPRVTIGAAGPYRGDSTHSVSWDTMGAADRNEPLCLFSSRGALGWRWVQLGRC